MTKCRIQLPIPTAAENHLKEAVVKKRITDQDFLVIRKWILKPSMVVVGDWYKRFNCGYLVGTGPVPKSILGPKMTPWGEEVF